MTNILLKKYLSLSYDLILTKIWTFYLIEYNKYDVKFHKIEKLMQFLSIFTKKSLILSKITFVGSGRLAMSEDKIKGWAVIGGYANINYCLDQSEARSIIVTLLYSPLLTHGFFHTFCGLSCFHLFILHFHLIFNQNVIMTKIIIWKKLALGFK